MNPINFNIFKAIADSHAESAYVINKPRGQDGVDMQVVCHADQDAYITEQFRAMRTNLYTLSAEKELKTILITSAQPKEGKSITSANLAITLSSDKGKKVALVDADLRRPTISRLFDIPNVPGLTNLLRGDAELEQFFRKPSCANLYILPSGTPVDNSAEILISKNIKVILGKLKEKFDYIILDSAPVLSVTDAAILGTLCDAVILVVKADVTQKPLIQEAFNILKDAQAKPIATILTNYYLPKYYFHRAKYNYKKYYSKIVPK